MTKNFLKTHLAMILAVVSIIISLLLMKAFYRFDIFFASEGLFVPYGYFIAKKEWIEATVKLGLWSLLFTGLLFCLTLTFHKRKKLALGFGISSLVIAICFYASFYVIYPDYNYEYHPYMFGYMTWDGQYIANTDRYFQTVEKYGFEPKAYRPFQTLDDAIKGLEFAKNKDDGLYSYIFQDLEKYGYKNVFKKYDNKYFQLYFLDEMLIDLGILNKYFFENHIEKLDIYKENISDVQVKSLYTQFVKEYLALKSKDPNYNQPMFDYRDKMKLEIENLIKN